MFSGVNSLSNSTIRYYSLDTYLKGRFGSKVYKLSLNGGMTCPNRDGTIGTGGCIFCNNGSGEFTGNISASDNILDKSVNSFCLPLRQTPESIKQQLNVARKLVSGKISNGKYIAYFQAFTNTYAPVSYLRSIFMAAMEPDDIIALSVATRPDCLDSEVLSLLTELNQIKPVFVELGLQTVNEDSAVRIRRGYPLSVFNEAVARLSQLKLMTVVHLILGLPYETTMDMLSSIDYIAALPIHGVKLSMLHVLKDTDLAPMYYANPAAFPLMEESDYIDCLIRCLERLPMHMVIHRITGDGPKQLLIAPLWSCNKKQVLNNIHKELKKRGTYQGKDVKYAGRDQNAL